MIDAMARSPWVEHKISLAEAYEAGSPLASRVAEITGLSENALSELIGQLPEMDFYLADKNQRRTWTASGQSASVAASVDGDSYVEYLSTGRAVSYQRSGASRPLFAIHPAEVKMYRAQRSNPSQGVIAGPGNVDGGLLIKIFDEHGREMTIDAGKLGLRNGREVRAYIRTLGIGTSVGAGIRPQAGAATAALFIEQALVNNIPDGVGQSEILLKMWKDNGASPGSDDCCRQEWTYGSVEPLDTLVGDPCPTNEADPYCYTYCDEGPATVFSGWYPSGSYPHFRVQLFEEDTGPDDVFGYYYWGSNPPASAASNGGEQIWTDASRCDPVSFQCFKMTVGWTTS
ncbi:MAG: hypothetical protein ACRENP_09850 [Longimicrobiales bacterium]